MSELQRLFTYVSPKNGKRIITKSITTNQTHTKLATLHALARGASF